MNPTDLPPAAAGPASDQPLTIAEEAAAPVVPPPGTHPAGFDPIGGHPQKLWYAGTLVYAGGGLMVLFFWLLFGDFALSMRERSVGPVVQLMLGGFGISNLTMSVLLSMVPTVIAMVLSPIVSYKSDRYRSRWGRRIPFLLIPTPIAAVAMIGLAFTPHLATMLQHLSGDAIGRKAALLSVFAVCWTAFEIAAITAGSVLGGLFNDVVPRPVIGRFFGLFRAVSLIDGMIFNWCILNHAEAHFTAIFLWVGLVYGVGFSLMCLMIKEGDYPDPALSPDDPRGHGVVAAVRVYLRECFSHSHYRWIFAALTLCGMAANPINAWSLLYAKQLGMTRDAWDAAGIGFGTYRIGYGGIMTLTYICSLCLAYPIGSLADRFHPMRVATVAMLLYAVTCLTGWAMLHDVRSFGWAILAHGVLSGTYFTASAALGQVLLPRLRFSQFSSAGLIVSQLVSLIYTPLLGELLDLTGSNYRITFLLSGIFATAAFLLLFRVYRTFMAMGGPAGYVAPLDEVPAVRGFPV